MANTGQTNRWEKIQLGVKETERLIGQKNYNSAMVRARQTLEFMVKLLCERAGLAEGEDLKASIDSLYENGWINKITFEHYHKIRMIGNKAVHEEDNSAYNANQAYHILSQEVYTFANDYSNAQRGSRPARSSSASQRTNTARSASASQRTNTARGASASARGTSASRSQAMRSSNATRSRRRQGRARQTLTPYDLLKLLIPVLCIILLFCVVRLVKPRKEETPETTPAVTTEAPTTAAPAPTTEQPPETTSAAVYRTTTVLNVRSAPSTDAQRVGQLDEGAAVEYVRAHDGEWAVIIYGGQEAYVASQYLTTD